MHHLSNNICVVVAAESLQDFINQLEKVQKVADFIELRLDYIKDLKPTDLAQIAKHTHKKSIACCRAIAEMGKFSGGQADQQAILQTANDLGFDYIDIDLAIIDHIQIKNKKAQFIISFHDFERTPDLNKLNRIAEQMRSFSADILKFAVHANSDKDVNTLCQLLINKPADESMIALSMGEHGKKLRLLSPLLGGYLTFASLDNQGTAPGQIEFKDMNSMYQQIENLIK